MLLGQANNKVVYFWRLHILNVSLNSKFEVKVRLNTHDPLLLTNSAEPFGCQLRKQQLDNNKVQKETWEMFKEVDWVSIKKQTTTEMKFSKPQQNSPSTFPNAAATKMAEKYIKPNSQ